jgi:hypothetical protein
MKYFSVCPEDTLGRGIQELESDTAIENLYAIHIEMNESLNTMYAALPIFEQFGAIKSVIKSGSGYKALILYRGDFTSKKRRDVQHMIEDAINGVSE